LEELLQQEGFTLQEEGAHLFMELDSWDPVPPASPLRFKRVESPEQLQQFADLIASALPDSSLPPILYCGKAPLQLYIGYLESVPVVTGMLLTHANIAGIYCIATTPEQRNNGFGMAMMHHLLSLAKAAGYFIATTQSPNDCLPFHEQLDFHKCCQYSKFTSP
jgi:ribosomal protein S18 acetylase RimI-like enzyme